MPSAKSHRHSPPRASLIQNHVSYLFFTNPLTSVISVSALPHLRKCIPLFCLLEGTSLPPGTFSSPYKSIPFLSIWDKKICKSCHLLQHMLQDCSLVALYLLADGKQVYPTDISSQQTTSKKFLLADARNTILLKELPFWRLIPPLLCIPDCSVRNPREHLQQIFHGDSEDVFESTQSDVWSELRQQEPVPWHFRRKVRQSTPVADNTDDNHADHPFSETVRPENQ